jgi:hypothetical protein
MSRNRDLVLSEEMKRQIDKAAAPEASSGTGKEGRAEEHLRDTLEDLSVRSFPGRIEDVIKKDDVPVWKKSTCC